MCVAAPYEADAAEYLRQNPHCARYYGQSNSRPAANEQLCPECGKFIVVKDGKDHNLSLRGHLNSCASRKRKETGIPQDGIDSDEFDLNDLRSDETNSGYTGVYYENEDKPEESPRFCAALIEKDRVKRLGTFESASRAAIAVARRVAMTSKDKSADPNLFVFNPNPASKAAMFSAKPWAAAWPQTKHTAPAHTTGAAQKSSTHPVKTHEQASHLTVSARCDKAAQQRLSRSEHLSTDALYKATPEYDEQVDAFCFLLVSKISEQMNAPNMAVMIRFGKASWEQNTAEYELQQALSKWKESNRKPQILAAKARVLQAKEVLATAKEKLDQIRTSFVTSSRGQLLPPPPSENEISDAADTVRQSHQIETKPHYHGESIASTPRVTCKCARCPTMRESGKQWRRGPAGVGLCQACVMVWRRFAKNLYNTGGTHTVIVCLCGRTRNATIAECRCGSTGGAPGAPPEQTPQSELNTAAKSKVSAEPAGASLQHQHTAAASQHQWHAEHQHTEEDLDDDDEDSNAFTSSKSDKVDEVLQQMGVSVNDRADEMLRAMGLGTAHGSRDGQPVKNKTSSLISAAQKVQSIYDDGR